MNSLKIIFRSACIAAMGGMLGNAAQAQEITAATLKGMSESSAVRMGCGAAFIGDMNGDASVNAVGMVRDTADMGRVLSTRAIGTLCLLAIVFVALRVIPKEKKEVLWKLIKAGALATFLSGVLFVMQNPWAPVDDFTGAALWASILITVPVIISTIVRSIWAMAKFLLRESDYAAKQVEAERAEAGKMPAVPERAGAGKMPAVPEAADAGKMPAVPEAAGAGKMPAVLTVSVRGQEVTLRDGDTQVTRVVDLDEEACATK